MIAIILGAILFGLAGCSTASKEPPKEPFPEVEVNGELSQCRKWFGEKAEASIISHDEFQCRVEVEDQGGLTQLFAKWKMKNMKARNSGATDAEVKKINKAWEKSAQEYNENRCPKRLNASAVPFNNKIVCTSANFSRSVIYLSKPKEAGG